MIKVTVEETLPEVNLNLPMQKVAEIMYQSALEQFNTSGHGRWLPTREGKQSNLRGVRETLEKSSGENWAEISFMRTVHQRGGPMLMTERQKRFMWAKYYDEKDDRYKWMALSRGGYMIFPIRAISLEAEDIDRIKEVIGNNLFTIREI